MSGKMNLMVTLAKLLPTEELVEKLEEALSLYKEVILTSPDDEEQVKHVTGMVELHCMLLQTNLATAKMSIADVNDKLDTIDRTHEMVKRLEGDNN